MTKKVLFGMAAFTMLFASSCQNELDVISSSGTSTVSFKVETPEIQSRAFSDGATATVLQYAVYNSKGEELDDLTVTNGEIHGSTTVELQLTTGNSYSVIFWAGAPDAPYTVDFANKTMTVDYTDAKTKSNDENRDAFYKYHTFTVNGAQTETIELKRPFAQLNIGTADFDASAKAGYTATQSKVKVSNVYTTLNFVDGAVSNPTSEDNTVTFALANIPAKYDATAMTGEQFPVEGYDYLAMNYLLVAAEKETIEVEYTYTDANNDSKTRTVGSVPVQRNYRTNIYGNLLTSEVDMNVEIKPDYDDPAYNIYNVTVDGVSYSNFTEAVAKAIELGMPIEFIENVKLAEDEFVTVKAGESLTLNLNGFSLSGTDNTTKNFGLIDNRGTLVVNGPGLIGLTAKQDRDWNAYSSVISNNPGGVLTVQNGAIIEHFGGTDMAYGIDNLTNGKGTSAITTVDGATVKSTYSAVRQFLNGIEAINELYVKSGSVLESKNRSIFFQDPSKNANTGKLVVEDGAKLQGEVRLSVTAGSSEWPVEVSVADAALVGDSKVTGSNVPAGYMVIEKGGYWTVVEGVVSTETTDGLQAALDAATDGATIKLTAGVKYDVVYLGRPTKNNATTMFCETHNFTTTDAAEFSAHLNDGQWHSTPKYTTTLKNVTIVGAEGATIAGLVATSGHMYASNGTVHDYVLDVDKSGSGYYSTLHLENIYFKNVAFTGKIDINTSDATSTYDGVTFDGCTFTTGGTASSNGAAIRYYNEANNGNVKNIVVKNSKFNNCYQGVYVQNVNGITVTGSEFDTTGHNAIAMQSTGEDAVNLKNVVIENNTFKNIADRVIRFNYVGADSNITIQYNTATNSGDDENEVMKATSIATGITTNIGFNNWGANAVVANDELKDKSFYIATSDELAAALKAENDGVTVVLKAGTYAGVSFTNPVNFKAKNLTIIGEEGVTIEGFSINGWTADSNIEIDGLTFKNITFSKGLLLSTKSMANVTVEECDFIIDACIHQNDNTEKLTNLVVKDCTFTGDKNGTTTAIMLENTENVSVTGCTFTNIDFNVLQGGTLSGDILFDNNKVNGTGDRVFRFVTTTDADITITNNTIVSDGDENGELAKATNAVEITLTGNTWNGNSDAEVAAKLINITAK